MYLFGKKDTIVVIGGMILCHILDCGLCMFFVYKFLIITYDAGVFLLLGVLMGPLIICDIMALKQQAFSRFLVRCKVNQEGIHCSYIGKKWSIKWCDIHIFGITGFSSFTQTGIVFFSADPSEKYQAKLLTLISNKRICFSINEKRWRTFSAHMPDAMKRKLEKAIDGAHDCYYRR